MVVTPEPRAWAGVDAGCFGDDSRKLDWLAASNPEQTIRRGAAIEQHLIAAGFLVQAGRRAEADGVSSPMRWLEARVRTMSYDTMWSVLRGRTWMTLVHMRDFETALKPDGPAE